MLRRVEKILTDGGIEKNEARAEAKLLVCEVLGFSVEEILAGKMAQNDVDGANNAHRRVCTNGEAEIMDKILDLAKKRVETKAPIQHILGFSYFMGDKFFVDENVLIPRPETELLVQSTVEIVQNNFKDYKKTLSILDIGTGTGCIPCEISKMLLDKGFCDVEIMGVDISTDALHVAIKNMEALGQQRRVIFRKSDIYSGLRPIDKFDIIVSNPPYIPISARETLQDEVKNFDPDLALFAADDMGVEFYERIINGAKKHLKALDNNDFESGYLLFELGFTNGVSQAPIVSKIAQAHGFKIEFVREDLAGIKRVICFSI